MTLLDGDLLLSHPPSSGASLVEMTYYDHRLSLRVEHQFASVQKGGLDTDHSPFQRQEESMVCYVWSLAQLVLPAGPLGNKSLFSWEREGVPQSRLKVHVSLGGPTDLHV